LHKGHRRKGPYGINLSSRPAGPTNKKGLDPRLHLQNTPTSQGIKKWHWRGKKQPNGAGKHSA